MASVKSIAVYSDVPWAGGLRKRRYEIVLTDNQAIDHTIITMPVKQQLVDDGSLIATQFLEDKKESELNQGDIPTQWNDTQADYDRRALGMAMLIEDVDEFYALLPLFKAMEIRGGANAIQRAIYLGVSNGNYTLIADRFGDVEGISFFLDNAKDQIWDELPEEFN